MNYLLIILLANIFWLAYCFFEGVREGMVQVYEENTRREISINYRKIFKIQAILFLTLMAYITFKYIDFYAIPLIISYILLFRYLTTLSSDCAVKNIKYSTTKYTQKKYINSMVIGISVQILLIVIIIFTKL
jgi:hypothetical protein